MYISIHDRNRTRKVLTWVLYRKPEQALNCIGYLIHATTYMYTSANILMQQLPPGIRVGARNEFDMTKVVLMVPACKGVSQTLNARLKEA